MSGHSHWATIKRKKGAGDAKRGQLFTKLAKEITLAARDGADPGMNFKLRLSIDKARANNMPKDSIDRAIKRGSGDSKDGKVFEEVTYEGYGPKGVAMILECVTENRNRTVAEIRHALSRAGGRGRHRRPESGAHPPPDFYEPERTNRVRGAGMV